MNNHWDNFASFCKWEVASGGPDPQIKMVARMSESQVWTERLWRAGCYIAVYNVPFAEVLWANMPYHKVKKNGVEWMGSWLNANWHRLVTRVERKTVRRPEWMYEYMNSYYSFITDGSLHKALKHCENMDSEERYLYFWDLTIKDVKRYGRYVALKLLESYNLFCDIELKAPDIRPKDGWSPRITLSVLFPEYEKEMNDNDNKWNPLVNEVVKQTQANLLRQYGVDINLFQLQVMLCEYRESYHSKKQYPGRSLDSELGYHHKVQSLWGKASDSMLIARAGLFPHKHLGELNGWLGTRKECGQVLATYGYTWTDLVYSYNATFINDRFANPVRWDEQ